MIEEKNFQIQKRGIGIENEKYANKKNQKSMETSWRWSSVIIEQRDKRKINSKAFVISILTASGL